MKERNGTIFNIQRMSVQDGPGIRTTIFLKGCGLRCFWCHNPESLSPAPQLAVYPDRCIGCKACLSVCPTGARAWAMGAVASLPPDGLGFAQHPNGGTAPLSDAGSFPPQGGSSREGPQDWLPAGASSFGPVRQEIQPPTGAAPLSDAGFPAPVCLSCGACANVCYAGSLQLFGRSITPEEACAEALRDRDFYNLNASGSAPKGGVTLSGGEPLLQWEFAAATARLCQDQGLPVALDTALFAPTQALEALLPHTDLFLIDCKAADPALHQKGTGQDNRLIQQHTRMVSASGKPYWIRIPLIPGFNDTKEEFSAMGNFLCSLPNPPQRVELMPFHNFCLAKYQSLGMDFPAAHLSPPPKEQTAELSSLLREKGLPAVP